MDARERNTAALVAAACFLATLALYAPSFGFGWFGVDDSAHIVSNPHLVEGHSAGNLRWVWTTFYASNWFPLTWHSWLLDHALFGMDPGAFHRTNVLLHALSCSVLFLAWWRMTGAVWRSAFVAGVFALHPLHVETVAWISERKGVLSGLFWMLAMLAYAESVRRPGRGARAAVAMAMLLGLCAKSVLVTLPFALLLLDYWPLRRLGDADGSFDVAQLRARALEKWPLFALTVLGVAIAFVAQRAGGAMADLESVSLSMRVENAIVSYWTYLQKSFWPRDLAILYPYRTDLSLLLVRGALAALSGVTAACWLLRRSRPALLVGWLWFLGTLVPMIGVVQLGTQALADRYTYIPLIGLAAALAWGVGDLRGWSARLAAACGVAMLAVSALASQRQLLLWSDTAILLRHTAQVTDANHRVERLLAEELVLRGEYVEAEVWIERALETAPHHAMSWTTRGELERARGDRESALAHFQRAVELDPGEFTAHAAIGGILLRRGELAAACHHLTRAWQASYGMDMAPIRRDLGICLVERGEGASALPHLEFAVAHGAPREPLAAYLALARAAADPGSGTERLERLGALSLETPGLRRVYAEVLVGAGRRAEAAAQLEAALALAARVRLPASERDEIRVRLREIRAAQ